MRIASAAVGFVLCGAGFAQIADSKLAFEVAAVRPSTLGSIGHPGAMQGGPGTSDPERIAWTDVPLQFLVTSAYGMRGDQFSGPGWLGSARFDLSAKVPTGATREQFNRMLQNLLIERFHLEVHRETRSVPAYTLVLGKNEPKLKPSIPGAAVTVAGPPAEQMLSTDQLHLVGTSGKNGQFVITAEGATLALLARTLTSRLGRRVVDKTGLAGEYDFTLEFRGSPSPAETTIDPTPDVFDALRQQLGLDLEETKVPLDVLVVDRIDRAPTEN